MAYRVKEIFASVQGEGFHAGRPAVFCRFAGCNLWSGSEAERASAVCRFCDTDFIGANEPYGGIYPDAGALAGALMGAWREAHAMSLAPPFVVLTGGEPALQVDVDLLSALHEQNATTAVETNGTLPLPADLDWICVSPKANAPLRQRLGHELKLVYPQAGLAPAVFENLAFEHFYLLPRHDAAYAENLRAAIDYCRRNPFWHLSLQMHRIWGRQ